MQQSRRQLFSQDEGLALKALCIIVVIMHNYLHLRGFAAENEFQFYAERVGHMWQLVLHPDWHLPLHVVSFIVSYALVGFLFCSGYGLVKKYEQGDADFNRRHFVSHHYIKLIKLLALPLIVAFVVFTVLRGHLPLNWKDTLLEFLLLGNLQWDVSIYPFVYWYLGMALQLYVLYALLLHRRNGYYDTWHQALLVALVIGCGVWQMCCAPTGKWIYYLRTNMPGYIGPFVMGMVTARHLDHISLKRWQWGAMALMGGVLMALSLGNYYTWLWGWVPTLVFMVGTIKAVRWLQWRPIVWLGSVSAMVYVIHPIVREVSLHYKHPNHSVADLVIYMTVSVILAAGYAWLLRRIHNVNQH